MQIQKFRTVDQLPALHHEEQQLLIISDLHLGLEGLMTSDGNYIPKNQLDRLKDDLEKAREQTGAEKLVINGDLKNEFKTSRYSETREITEFLKHAKKLFEQVKPVKGNHDTFIETTVQKQGLNLPEYRVIGKMLYTHGHKKIEELDVEKSYDTVVIGHEHPALALKDEIGVKEKIPCLLHGETSEGKNIIVLPAFSTFSNGTNINETPQKELLSPILRNQVDKNKLKAVAVSREAGLFKFPEIGKI
ncbi:MAG: metallophosphoesterase, partial [Candidatus Nanohaloarchaea archaeon]